MNRLIPIIIIGSLSLAGTAFAQSVEPPSLSGLGEAITGAVSDALSNTAADVSGGPGFLDPETGEDDTLDPETGPETGNDSERRRPLDISAVGHEDIQGVVLVCKQLKARGGNPLEGLNVGKKGPTNLANPVPFVVLPAHGVGNGNRNPSSLGVSGPYNSPLTY